MTVGIAASLANSQLDAELGTSYFQLHTGDPGDDGTSNVASTTRVASDYASASAGSAALSTSSVWTDWADGSVTLSHVSLWSADTAGTFKRSMALSPTRAIVNGDTFSLDTATVSYAPIAAD